jgi:hypothetical protein
MRYTVCKIIAMERVAEKTRVAVLGTVADLHKEPVQYNLAFLEQLVEQLEPDLLCADIRPDHWEQGDLSAAAVEYREALVPLAERTNIVIVPVCGATAYNWAPPHTGPLRGLRAAAVRWVNAGLWWLQRRAGTPETINSGWFGHLCELACALSVQLCDGVTRQQWQMANQELFDNILQAVRRDPGRRVLVTVDCWRRHSLQQRLCRVPEIELVDFRQL